MNDDALVMIVVRQGERQPEAWLEHVSEWTRARRASYSCPPGWMRSPCYRTDARKVTVKTIDHWAKRSPYGATSDTQWGYAQVVPDNPPEKRADADALRDALVALSPLVVAQDRQALARTIESTLAQKWARSWAVQLWINDFDDLYEEIGP